MKAELENYIQDNLDELDRKQPDPAILDSVLSQLKQIEKPVVKSKPGILISFRMMRWAAACIIVVASGLGLVVWQSKKQNGPGTIAKKSIIHPQQVVVPPVATADLTRSGRHGIIHPGIDAIDDDLQQRKKVIAGKLREHKMVSFAGFSNISSAAGRISAVAATAALANTRNEVVDGLVDVLNRDVNTNVRLAALDGLARFYSDGYTRKKLLTSLKKQKDPLVQITLIGLLTRMREAGIVAELEKMIGDQGTEKNVKDCAYSSMLQLQ